MKKLLSTCATALTLTLTGHGQGINTNTTTVFPPSELAVLKAGNGTTNWAISVAKGQPCYIQVFDTNTANQTTPLVNFALPTNSPNGIWINAHAGSEGGGISRSVNREFLALEGYTGNIIASPTPSSDSAVYRGFGTVDAFTNEQVIYQDVANWFGMPPGITQNNPTGIATMDGTNFWGTGNVTGTSEEASGVLFYNQYESGLPQEIENYIQGANEARIIGGTLYVAVKGTGIFNFVDPANNDAVVPLPYDPDVPNSVQHPVFTNLFLTWGTNANVANFDMNPQGTIAYGADQVNGIVKMINVNGQWQQAYTFAPTNLGTQGQSASAPGTGCFGICVDFTGVNPVIYATTMEYGNSKAGNPNKNRVIRIVDTGNPGTGSNLVAVTLAQAGTTNENFRGLDFTPDLRPLISSEPADFWTISAGSASFSVAAQSVFPLSYQWSVNGAPITGQTSATLSLSDLNTSSNGDIFTCAVSNQYGVATSSSATLYVTATPVAPTITNSPNYVTAFVGGNLVLPAVSPSAGTEPYSFQWYFQGSALSDATKYFGSQTASLTISNLATTDSGSYYIVASNDGGFTSNLVDVVSVNYHLPIITAGEPLSAQTFVGYTATLTATESGGSPPVTAQWYKITATSTNEMTDDSTHSGSQTSTLTFENASLSDAASYEIVYSNPGGNVTSSLARLTVTVAPPHSYVGYSNQTYFQNFDSLPDPGSNSVNSFNNPLDPGQIVVGGVTNAYSLANPFDFAFPVTTASYIGGLGLSNTMPGWYGAADTLYPGEDGITRFGAQDGDQTTGGIIDFGPNDNPPLIGTNRALGLLSTSTTAGTTFAVKLINETTNNLNYISLSFIGELWHNGTGTREMTCAYALDPSATNFLLTYEAATNAETISNLCFSFPTAPVVTTVDGTQATNQIDLGTNNLALSSPWTPGGALWLVWWINFYGSGSGNGYAIDNLNFSASTTTNITVTTPNINGVSYASSGVNAGLQLAFTNTPGAASSFTIWMTTNLVAPIQWVSLGHPTEGSPGSYLFLDPSATNAPSRFYEVTSP